MSNRCWQGETENPSGPFAARLPVDYGIDTSLPLVSDELEAIQEAIISASKGGACLVFTTGGTGFAPRDVTSEVVEALPSTRIYGLEDVVCRTGEGHAPAVALSRGLMGVTSRAPGGVLAVSAPDSSGGVKDAVGVIGSLVMHILDQLAGGDHSR